MKRLAAAALLGACALGGAYFAFETGAFIGPLTPGVDVSHHQGAIDWKALARTDIRFAYIKATEGGDYVDPTFAQNWKEAGAAGLMRGAYHFFTLCQSGEAQATAFISTVPIEPGALPPALDLEHMGPCRKGPMIENVDGEIKIAIAQLEKHYGARPILYTTREFHDAHLIAFNGERFWIRALFAPPDFRQHDWIFWQRHNAAHRAGISGPVDLNAFRGDEGALASMAQRKN